MKANNHEPKMFLTKADIIIKIIIRWMIFFAFIFVLLITARIWVHKTAAATLAAIPVIKLPDYPPAALLTDVEIRKKYLDYRVRGIHFDVYKIKQKDNLWKIAKPYGYTVHTIIGCNPQLKTYDIYIGQKILVPSSGGTLHPIQRNDTWEIIAERYDIEAEILKNTNFSVDELIPGTYIFVPGKRPAVDLMNEDMQEKYALRELFSWPLSIGGRISSTFGLRKKHPITGVASMHGGMDIAVPIGTPVAAAADGVVILAATDVGHYGTAVYIDHKNGYVTHYGHLSSYNVKVGQKVKAGRLIGRSGATGRVTGPHLHFTVKKGNKTIDPQTFLW
ncbi:MAG: M23 family metallopeptidase [Endomicrobium sp.]|jgi:murein DD-endopeptidase MepM/ murein hydrolase activator NlpD|nr:M23 family metallopeptidase [Endomicrobium sp.]